MVQEELDPKHYLKLFEDIFLQILLQLSATAIIPVIVLAALVGYTTTFVRKKHPESMDNLMNVMDRACMSVMTLWENYAISCYGYANNFTTTRAIEHYL
nr:hypothetical protein [Entomoplasma sp. MP1]